MLWITSVGLGRSYRVLNRTCTDHMQDKYLTCCTISLPSKNKNIFCILVSRAHIAEINIKWWNIWKVIRIKWVMRIKTRRKQYREQNKITRTSQCLSEPQLCLMFFKVIQINIIIKANYYIKNTPILTMV